MNIFNEELSIKSLIKYSVEEKIWLPEFQRPFVWDRNQVRLLIDSLFSDYTINSILLWEGGDELARRRVGGSINEIKIPEDKNEKVLYLLDGQQRTTALLLAFTSKEIYKGNNKKKTEQLNIYWDSEYEGTDPELRWIFDDEKICLNQESENQEENHRIMFKEKSSIDIIKEYNGRYVNIKHAYNFEADENFIFQVMGEEKGKSFLYDYSRKLNTLDKNILQRKVNEIPQKGTLEQVLVVFERINTQNTKLSIFDIMVAKTFRKKDKGYFDLRDYYKLINYTDSINKDYFKSLEDIDLDKIELHINESDFLSIISILLQQKFKATEIFKLKTEILMENLKKTHEQYKLLIDFVHNNFNVEYVDLWKFQPMMKFLASVISNNNSIDLTTNKFLQTWFWNTLLKNRYPGAQNEKIAKDYEHFSKSTDYISLITQMKRDNTRDFQFIKNITKENLDLFEAYYSSKSQQMYRALILLLKSKQAKDFYSAIEPQKSGAKKNFLEEHHIFPYSSKIGKKIREDYKDNRYNDILNNIANIALITKETNNDRIKAKNPSEYIKSFEQEYTDIGKQNEFSEIMSSQFISEEMIIDLKQDNFDDFIVKRTNLILEQIELLCNGIL